MTIKWSWPFFFVGWALVFISVIVSLGSGPFLLLLLLGLVHLAIAALLRSRERRSST